MSVGNFGVGFDYARRATVDLVSAKACASARAPPVMTGATRSRVSIACADDVSGGVSLETSSEASFDPGVSGSSITANPGGGVSVYDVSLANFIDSRTTVKDTITGNGSTDVICSGGHAFAVGLANLAAATTNCTAP